MLPAASSVWSPPEASFASWRGSASWRRSTSTSRGKNNYNRTYGALGGALNLLLMFYLNAAILLIGAEINSEIDRNPSEE